MSETAPESTAPRSSGGGAMATLGRKMGPLPIWGWMVVMLVIAGVYYFIKSSKSKSGSSTNTGTGSAAGSTSVDSPGGVDASLVPQFVNQTFNETAPPTAPTVNVTVPPNTPATPTPSTSQTVSGAPGSYSLNVGGSGNDEWTSTGKYSLATVAKSHGMTPQQLIAVSESAENNPLLKAYVAKGNYNAPVPSGVQLFIPAANWKLT